ncbi:MAG: hypothetical protein ACRDSN_05770, partial [Pseudonocardiaceae bacterium]
PTFCRPSIRSTDTHASRSAIKPVPERHAGLTAAGLGASVRGMGEVPGAATFKTSAEAYDRHVGRYGRELARELIAATEVRPRRRALDVGCGPGALTTELVHTRFVPSEFQAA